MFKRILCPVDFSSRSRSSARVARAFADRFNSELILLHTAPNGAPAELAEANRFLIDIVTKEIEPRLALPCILTGNAADQIVQLAHDRNVELVVIGTHGMSPFNKSKIGSVVSKVLHHATCPVWTSPHEQSPGRSEVAPPRSIVCGLDFGRRSCAALHWASCIAKEFGAKLMLAHVIVPDERENYGESPEETLRRQQERLSTPAHAKILEGNPADALQRLAETMAADLLVIGRTHASSSGLGANAYSIISNSPCPVLSA